MSNPLPTPPPCGAGRDIRLQAIQKDYKGPWTYNTIMTMSPTEADISYSHGLAAMGPSIPKEFSWRKKGGDRIESGRNQGQCGSCWAFAAAGVLGDRFAIKYNIKAPYPSVAWTLSCGDDPNKQIPPDLLCKKGGNPIYAGRYYEQKGTKTEACWPYALVANHNYTATPCLAGVPENCCLSCCGSGNGSDTVFKAKKGSTRQIYVKGNDGKPDAQGTTAAIQREIMNNGTVAACYFVADDFMGWWQANAGSKKIYMPTVAIDQSKLQGHAVALTGWGEQNGVRYWEMRNSWGEPSYCRYAFSLDTPREFWTGLDVPVFIPAANGAQGGVVAFDAGDKPDGKFDTATGHISVIGEGGGNGLNIDWKWIAAGGGVLLTIVLIIIVINRNRGRGGRSGRGRYGR